MNQGIPFARTVRALDADTFRTSKLGLLLAAAVLAGWVWWALAARIPQYETSTNVHLDPSGQTAVAYFPALPQASLRMGQSALLRANSSSIPAKVTNADEQNDGQTRVTLQLLEPASHLPPPISVEVETERVSPATIALRAAGLKRP